MAPVPFRTLGRQPRAEVICLSSPAPRSVRRKQPAMKSAARVQFWGTRGSLAKPGRDTVRYGGNTTCVKLTSPGGTLVIVDCGTGAHDLGQALLAEADGPMRGSILISHTHWDHIQGFPFFAPLFVPGNQWDIYGPAGLGQSLRETLAGQMQYSYFPLALDDLGASIRFHDLVEGTLEIGDIRITTRYLNHPVLTLAYRFDMAGISVVHASDHEPFTFDAAAPDQLSDRDAEHAKFLAGADLVIHDAQFTDAEYPAKKGWGHSPIGYVTAICRAAGVKQVALTHHDPLRKDDALDRIVESVRADLLARKSDLHAFAAKDQQIVEVRAASVAAPRHPEPIASAAAPAIKEFTVIMGISDTKLAVALAEATRAEGVRMSHASDAATLFQCSRATPPALVLIEDPLSGEDGLGLCQTLRSGGEAALNGTPVIIIADREREDEGRAAGVTGWLVRPFTTQYARAHIQSWILRTACRWARAAVPPDEAVRIATLRTLGLLDTPPEERFDRITRVATALANVPIAYVSLLDENRQWFKSCTGFVASETSRDVAICSHVVFLREPLIIPDTLQDSRFADNPLVTGEPGIRFYAGFPLFATNGSCLGTLCMLDMRPRQFAAPMLQMFADLAALVQNEINAGAISAPIAPAPKK